MVLADAAGVALFSLLDRLGGVGATDALKASLSKVGYARKETEGELKQLLAQQN
jgi:hypothetical protein